MPKASSAKHYQDNKQRLQNSVVKDITKDVFPKKKKKKSKRNNEDEKQRLVECRKSI